MPSPDMPHLSGMRAVWRPGRTGRVAPVPPLPARLRDRPAQAGRKAVPDVTPNADSGGRYWDHWSGPERKRLLDWIVESCLVHGAQESTAYLVASEFAKGLDHAR